MEGNRTGQKKNNLILPLITMIACAFLAFGVMAIFHACGPKEDGTWMSCHYAQIAVFALALVMTALSAACLPVIKAGNRHSAGKGNGDAAARKGAAKVCTVLYIVVAATAVAAAIIPGNVIHLCMMNEMRCRAVMRPSVILVSIVIVVLSLASAASLRPQWKAR